MYGNPMASKLQVYKRATVEMRSAPELLIDLCDAAVTNVERAMDCDDDASARESLFKARRIVVALQDSLSIETGGVVAVNLFRHYTYLARLLMEAQQNPAVADLELLRVKLADLADTWSQAVRIHQGECDAPARAS